MVSKYVKEITRREIQLVARHIADRFRNIVVHWDPHESATNWKKIVILEGNLVDGKEMTETEWWISKRGDGFHEAFHLLLTDSKVYLDFVNGYPYINKQIVKWVANCIEDAAIERLGVNIYPNALQKIRFTNEYWFLNNPDWGTGVIALVHGINMLGKVGDVPEAIKAQPDVMEQLYKIAPYIKEGREALSTEARMEAARKILETIRPYVEAHKPCFEGRSVPGLDEMRGKYTGSSAEDMEYSEDTHRKSVTIRFEKERKEAEEEAEESPAEEKATESETDSSAGADADEEEKGDDAADESGDDKSEENTDESEPTGDDDADSDEDEVDESADDEPAKSASLKEKPHDDGSEDEEEARELPEEAESADGADLSDEDDEEPDEADGEDEAPDDEEECDGAGGSEDLDESGNHSDDDAGEDDDSELDDGADSSGDDRMDVDEFGLDDDDLGRLDASLPSAKGDESHEPEDDAPVDEADPHETDGSESDDSAEANSDSRDTAPEGSPSSLKDGADVRDDDPEAPTGYVPEEVEDKIGDFDLESEKETLEKLIDAEIARERAEEEKRRSMMEDPSSERLTALMAPTLPVCHRGVRLVVSETSDRIDYRLLEMFEKEKQEVEPYVRFFVEEFRKTLRPKNTARKTGLVCGKVDPSRLYAFAAYGEIKIMEKPGEPGCIPDVAELALLDCSGSMGGESISRARQVAYLLARTNQQLKVPYSIVGWWADSSALIVRHRRAIPFSKCFQRDITERIADIQAREQNRDGYTLRVGTQELLQRPERIRILNFIFDGMPYHGGTSYEYRDGIDYTKDEVILDVARAVREAQEKGIVVLGYYIGREGHFPAAQFMIPYCIHVNDFAALPYIVADRRRRLLQRLL